MEQEKRILQSLLRARVTQINITSQVNTHLAREVSQFRPPQYFYGSLYAKVLVFERGIRKLCLVKTNLFTTFCLTLLTICVGLLHVSQAQNDTIRSIHEISTPYTYLFDTITPSSAPISVSSLSLNGGWTIVSEDDVTHNFKGDVVFLNDKLAVVLRKNGHGAEVYSKVANVLKLRAVLIPLPTAGNNVTGLSSVKIMENNPGAVMLNANFKTENGSDVSTRYRLTTGQIYVELFPGDGVVKLLVQSKSRYVVVPDFFGNDMVFGAGAFKGYRAGLPTENIFLNLLDGGDAIIMCVWQSNEQSAEIVLPREGQKRAISGSEIQCIKGKSIWIAFMESPDIWHERIITSKDESKEIILDWIPPFPAKWRASFISKDGTVRSWDFRSERESELGETGNPCRFRSNRAFISGRARGGNFKAVIVYPIDRNRATPLTLFCPTDIMRDTLGVGPCQYILDIEGFSPDSLTPDYVMDWVEKQFKRRRARRVSAKIKERFGQMINYIKHAQSRIKQYSDFAREVHELCAKEGRENPDISDAVRKLDNIAKQIERVIATRQGTTKPTESVTKLVNEIVALIGKENALAECQKLGAQIRAIGDAQNSTLSQCRMSVRRLKQQCSATNKHSPTANFVNGIRERVERILQGK